MTGNAIRSREEIDYFLFRLEFFENLPLQTVYLNGFHVFFLNVSLIFKQFTYLERRNFWTDFVNTTHGSVFPSTIFPIQVWTLYTVKWTEVALTLNNLH
jgi:hypothetical protein